jgi:hypothetical protein
MYYVPCTELHLVIWLFKNSGLNYTLHVVELAGQLQRADEFTRAVAGSKLTVIAEQVPYLELFSLPF